MTYRRAMATRNAVNDTEFNLLNSGTIEFWTGAQPGSVGGSESGNTKCATCTFGSTAFNASSSGSKTATSITSDTNAAASGTVQHAVLKTSAPAVHSDASCGLGSGDFNFDNNVIVAGGTVAVSSLTATAPT
jgi:hypothetical protein